MKTALFTLAIVGLTAVGAQANTFTETQTLSFGGTLNNNSLLTFDTFNEDVDRILCKVTIDVNLEILSGSAQVDNDGNVATVANVETGATSSISSGGEVAFGSNITAEALVMQVFNLTADDGDGAGADPSATDGAQIDLAGETATAQRMVTSALQLASFTDTFSGADFDLNVDSIFVIDIDATGVAGGFDPTTVAGEVTITYEYKVPEPASMALLGLGGLAVLRRRK